MDEPEPFRVLVVPGVTPGKWLRTWQERMPHVAVELVHVEADEQSAALRDGRADVGLVRLPLEGDGFSAIPLYTETTVVVVARDHLLTAVEEVTPGDLADEVLLVPADDVLGWTDAPGRAALGPPPGSTADAVELVAAGVGVLVVPQSLARLHHRRDVTYRPVTDAPTSGVALAWPADRTTDLVETFVGIVRGRTARSSRGPVAGGTTGGGTGGGAAETAARRGRPAQGGGSGGGARHRDAGRGRGTRGKGGSGRRKGR